MGLLTSNAVITDDVARLFNHLSGMAQETHYKRLLVAPHGVRRGLLENINTEIVNHKRGLPVRRADQGQLDRGRGRHRRALPGVAGRGAGRPVGARHLLGAARACPG